MLSSLISVAFLASAPALHARGVSEGKVRRPAVAGAFYPADPAELSEMIDRMLAEAAPQVDGVILAAVAPHAGYVYSGPVAAHTFAELKGRKFSRVVVIAPTHRVAFDYASVYDGDAYETPLGIVPVDKEFAQRLAEMSSTIQFSEKGHESTSAGGEHAIEVQLPWLQRVLSEFKIVPIVMGSQSYQGSRALGVALAKLIESESEQDSTLVLASSDMSHYRSYDDAQRLDGKTLQGLKNWDYLSMSRNFNAGVWEACGGAPIVAAMIYAERRGANRAEVLRYANSGDTSGDHSRVVGYGAEVFVKAASASTAKAEFSLTAQEKADLLALARHAVERIVTKQELFEPAVPVDVALNREAGAFVTLTRNGHLRGCIGYTSAMKPLYITVRDTATLAAMRDVRFQPVSAAELPELSYEVSVLSPLRRVTDVEQIEVGRDGLLMKSADREGLLLPQVPVEYKWDRARFLEETCVKAGMSRDSWKDEGTDIFRFTALVFNEKDAAELG